MTVYGPHAGGFRRKPVTAILDDIRASQWAEISASLDLSTVSPLGQNNGIFANELGIAWEILEICYHAFDPDAAQDFLLTSLSKLSGTLRRGSGYSRVPLTVELDIGTELLSGVHYAAVDGDSSSLWTPQENFTAPSTGFHEVVFRAENPGPVPAQVGTITVRHTAVLGWNSVTNATAPELGREIDTDEELRARREAQLTASGSATVDAIKADLLELDEVESCRVFENSTDAVVDGMPPHSIEAVIFDGEVPAADDDEIAQIIWDNKAAGIQTIGDESGTAVDAEGDPQTVNFTRPSVEEVYIEIDVEVGIAAKYAAAGGDAALAEFLVSNLKELHGVGTDVKWRRVDSLAFQFGEPGVIADVTGFRLGLTPSPVGTGNITISPRALASFDVSRVTVAS